MTSVKDFTKRVFGTSKIMTAAAITLIGVSLVLGGMFVAGWVDKEQKEAALEDGRTQPSDNTGSTSGSSQPSSQKLYTLAEVAQHATTDDCWMIVNANVYDLTSFLEQHPGGVASMSPYCGKDGTQGFATMGRNRGTTHSESANALKEEYKIGSLAN